jgi:RNA polymerase sigma factor for flagellar operon FliA
VRSDAEASALFDAHVGIAERIALSYSRRLGYRVELNELRAFAFIGLLDAARRFEQVSAESRFDYYARVRVRGAIRDGLRSLLWFQRRKSRTNPGCTRHVKPVYGIDLLELVDATPGADVQFERALVAETILRAVERLPHRERNIIQQHYFDGVRFDDLAHEQGVSPARISQVHRRAIERLRVILNGKSHLLGRD